jgi:hypothetical protein
MCSLADMTVLYANALPLYKASRPIIRYGATLAPLPDTLDNFESAIRACRPGRGQLGGGAENVHAPGGDLPTTPTGTNERRTVDRLALMTSKAIFCVSVRCAHTGTLRRPLASRRSSIWGQFQSLSAGPRAIRLRR